MLLHTEQGMKLFFRVTDSAANRPGIFGAGSQNMEGKTLGALPPTPEVSFNSSISRAIGSANFGHSPSKFPEFPFAQHPPTSIASLSSHFWPAAFIPLLPGLEASPRHRLSTASGSILVSTLAFAHSS